MSGLVLESLTGLTFPTSGERLLARPDVLAPELGPVARCTVARLMRAAGLAGAVRGRCTDAAACPG